MKLLALLLFLTVTLLVQAVEMQKIPLTLEPQELEFKPPYDSEYRTEYLNNDVKVSLSLRMFGNEKNGLSEMKLDIGMFIQKTGLQVLEGSREISLNEIPAEKITLFEIIDMKIEKKEDTLVLIVSHNKKIYEPAFASLEVKKPGTYLVYDLEMRGIKVVEIGEDSVTLQYVNVSSNGNKIVKCGKGTVKLKLKEKEKAKCVDSDLVIGIEKIVPKKSATITLSQIQINRQPEEYAEVKTYKSIYQISEGIELTEAQPVILRFQIEKKSIKIKVKDRSTDKAILEVYEGETPLCTTYLETCTLKLGEINQELGKGTDLAFLLSYINDYRATITIKPYIPAKLDCKPVEGAYHGNPEKKLNLLFVLGEASTVTNREYTEREFVDEINKRVNAFYSVPEFQKYRTKINMQYVYDERAMPDCNIEPKKGLWTCNILPEVYQSCNAKHIAVLVPSEYGKLKLDVTSDWLFTRTRTILGRSNAPGTTSITEMQNQNVAVHELAHSLFGLMDAYCCDGGGYSKDINAYGGNCDYAEAKFRERDLEEEYTDFKNGVNEQTKTGECTTFEPDQKIYPDLKEVSIVIPKDLMAIHDRLFLNFDAEYQVEQVMKEYPS